MKNEKLSLVFFGSGPVAAENLRLIADDFLIEAIITKSSTVEEMSGILPDVPLFTADNKSDLDSLFSEHNFSSKMGLLIDFGIIVSQKIIDSFPLGIVNSHFSLLPELRGADPISFAILEGKQKTGVSLMLLVEAMDEGPILTMKELNLSGTETATKLTKQLVTLSAEMLRESLIKYADNKLSPTAQELFAEEHGIEVSYTRKLTKQDSVIDWNKSAEQIEREIRAFIEWPKSRTTIGSVDVILTKAYTTPVNYPDNEPGEYEIIDDVHMLRIECGSGSLWIEELKPVGKKEMTTQAFLAGYKNRL